MSLSLKPQVINDQVTDLKNNIGLSEIMETTTFYEAYEETSFKFANIIKNNELDSSTTDKHPKSPQITFDKDTTTLPELNNISHTLSYPLPYSPITQYKNPSSDYGHEDDYNTHKSILQSKTYKEPQSQAQSISYQKQSFYDSSISFPFSPIDKVKFDINPGSLNITFMKKKLRSIPIKTKNVSKNNRHFDTLIELQNINCDQNRSPIWIFKFSCDGKYIATGGKKGTLKIFEVMTNEYDKYQEAYNDTDIIQYLHFINEQPLRTFNYHSSDIIDLSWSPFNKDQLLTASLDKYAILWSITSAFPLMKFNHGEMVTTIAFSPVHPDEFVTGSLDRFIRIWTIVKEAKPEYFNIKEKIISVSYFPSGESLAIGTHNGRVLIYDVIPSIRYNCSFNCRNTMGTNSKGKKVTNIEFVNKSAALITTSDSRLRYVSMPDGKLIYKYKGFSNESSMIRAHSDDTNDIIISGSEDKFCYIWHRLNMENNNKKNYSYEYFKPFSNDVVECSNFSSEQAMSAYIKKVYKLTTQFLIRSIIINCTDSGKLQVLLNITEKNNH